LIDRGLVGNFPGMVIYPKGFCFLLHCKELIVLQLPPPQTKGSTILHFGGYLMPLEVQTKRPPKCNVCVLLERNFFGLIACLDIQWKHNLYLFWYKICCLILY